MYRAKFAKRAFNIVEISIVVCLLITTIALCLPAIFNNTKGAKIISGWKSAYNDAKSNFEIFNMNEQAAIEYLCTNDNSHLENSIFEIVAPYLNADLTDGKDNLKDYSFKFFNGAQIPAKSKYSVRKFAYQENGNIVGLKWISCKCTDTEPCATIVFDVNGKAPPNRLGKDVFGLFIYKNSIEAFGYELSNDELENECSEKSGTGANCSEYYLRGGKF